MRTVSRRSILRIAIAGAAAPATLVGVSRSAPAANPEGVIDEADLKTFVELSSVLTGIDALKLAPIVDPIQVKIEYFKKAKAGASTKLDLLLTFYRKNKSSDPKDSEQKTVASTILSTAVARGNANELDKDLPFLARSIMVAWYTGTWYDPAGMREAAETALKPLPWPEVLSAAAYTQAWVWRVAQAHPMGYSELQFGYWSAEPPSFSAPANFMIKENGA